MVEVVLMSCLWVFQLMNIKIYFLPFLPTVPQSLSEAVSKRVRHDRVRGWAARPNRDSSRLQHTGRGLDVEPGHPSAA